MLEELSLDDLLFVLFAIFVAVPSLLSLLFVESTFIVIALNNFTLWAERKWRKK